jgi:hypothetical protein
MEGEVETHDCSNSGKIEKFAREFVSLQCTVSADATVNSMVLLQCYQRYVEMHVSKDQYNEWISTTIPFTRLQPILDIEGIEYVDSSKCFIKGLTPLTPIQPPSNLQTHSRNLDID